MDHFDIAIVGGGIAGASLAFRLAPQRRVLLVEMEPRFGIHASGRSATLFSEFYGNNAVQALTLHSRGFFTAPPRDFSEFPLLREHGALWIAAQDSQIAVAKDFEHGRSIVPSLEMVNYAQMRELCPVLRPEAAALGVFEPHAADLDATAMLAGYLKWARASGAILLANQAELHIRRNGGQWQLDMAGKSASAEILVNAAGGWCDQLAASVGSPGIGVRAYRRTLAIIDAPSGYDVRDWPVVTDLDDRYYFKPAGPNRLVISPADETEVAAQDVSADDLDVAIAVDRVMNATTINVNRVHSSWAGLRTFVANRSPVIGWDAEVPQLFWSAAHGGFGLMASPAISEVAAAILTGQHIPEPLRRNGITERLFAPAFVETANAHNKAAS